MGDTRRSNTLVEHSIGLTAIFDVLREPLRREILRRLAKGEQLCASFSDLGSPSGLSFHFTKLRTAGFTSTRKEGTCKAISLRTAALNAVFPGLLACVLKSIALENIDQSDSI